MFTPGFHLPQSSADSPKWEKSHPQNSNGSWRGCISSAVTALFYRGASCGWMAPQTNAVSVFAHLAALLTHWDFQKAFTQGEMPHGSNSLCKQNLTQNRPPVNSRQPRAHSYTLISHTNTFTLPSTTYRASQNSSFPHNNSFARSSLMPSHLRLRCH